MNLKTLILLALVAVSSVLLFSDWWQSIFNNRTLVTWPYDRTNRIVLTNDGNIDVYTLEYAMALASAGGIKLVGIVGENAAHYPDFIAMARRSGMHNIPNPVLGAFRQKRTLQRPLSGVIEDTSPLDTPGSRLIVQEALKATPRKPLLICTGGPLTSVADAYLLDNSIRDKAVVASVLGRENDMKDFNGSVDGWAAYIVLKRFRYIQFPSNLGLGQGPYVPKTRLADSEMPDTELKRHMIDKDQYNGLPGDRDADVLPLISVMRPEFVKSTKNVAFSHWVHVKPWFPEGHSQVPAFQDDPNGDTLVVTRVRQKVATEEWWRALENPAAYKGTIHKSWPFHGSPATIPGIIEAEEFDYGGQGIAYNDKEYNGWVKYRTLERVDLETSLDQGGGVNVTRLVSGEWLTYTVKVDISGTYSLTARVASSSGGGRFQVEFNETNKTGDVLVPGTGGPQNWQSIKVPGIQLAAGEGVMRFVISHGGFNLNYLNLDLENAN